MLGHVPLRGRRPIGPQQVAEADAVDVRLGHVLDLVGCLDPHQFEHGGEDVDGVDELVADRPRRLAESLAGQEMMQGSATPPWWTSRFQRLKGVLPAMVQPHG